MADEPKPLPGPRLKPLPACVVPDCYERATHTDVRNHEYNHYCAAHIPPPPGPEAGQLVPPDPNNNTADYTIPCPDMNCLAEAGEPCKVIGPSLVHFGRRVKRLMIQKRPDLLEPVN